MKIRFCEFCGNVLRDEPSCCDICGCALVQEVDEDAFNDPDFPWPFEPVLELCLRIQGRGRRICFDGTHSVYHLWDGLHTAYENRVLYFRTRKDEMELAEFPEGRQLTGFRLLEPGDLINCAHTRFSVYWYAEADPELSEDTDALEVTYQGSFQIEDCPKKEWGNVLGWLLATTPAAKADDGWTYDI